MFRERWPEFIFHDDVPKRYMGRVEEYFARYDIMVLDEGAVVAGGWAVPMAWDGTIDDLPSGYDDTLIRAVEGREAGIEPTSLSFMAVAVGSSRDKRGMAGVVLKELERRAHKLGDELAGQLASGTSGDVTRSYRGRQGTCLWCGQKLFGAAGYQLQKQAVQAVDQLGAGPAQGAAAIDQ